MTLREIIEILKDLACHVPNVGFVTTDDIYKLSEYQDIDFPSIVITQSQHTHQLDSGNYSYGFHLFYVDRLLEDKSNMEEIQSMAIKTLENLLADATALGINVIYDHQFNVFTERFQSECAGAYCTINLVTPILDCEWENVFDFFAKLLKKQLLNALDSKADKQDVLEVNQRVDELSAKTENKFGIIDSEIEEIENKISTLSSDTNSKFNIVNESLDNLDEKIDAVDNKVNRLSGKTDVHFKEIEDEIDKLEIKDNKLETKINNLSSETKSNFDNVNTELDRLDDKIDELSSKTDTHFSKVESSISKVDDKVNNLSSETKSNFDKVNTKIDNLDNEIDNVNNKVDNLSNDTNEKFDNVNEELTKLNGKIDKVDGKVNTFSSETKTNFDNVNKDIKRVDNKIDVVDGKVNELSAKTTNNINRLKDELNDVSEGLSGLTDEVSTIDKKVAEIAGNTAKTQSDLNELSKETEREFDDIKNSLNEISGKTGDNLSKKDFNTYSANTKVVIDKKADKSEIPTKVSQLTNDKGYITGYTETDPIWNAEKGNYALKAEIPTDYVDKETYSAYTASTRDLIKKIESEGYDDTEVRKLISKNTDEIAKKLPTNDFVVYSASTKVVLDNKADKSEIPTLVSQLTNDRGYITGFTETDPVWNAEKGNYALKTEIPTDYVDNEKYNAYTARTDEWIRTIESEGYDDTEVRQLISGNTDEIAKRLKTSDFNTYSANTKVVLDNKAEKSEIPTLVSQLTNDRGYITSFTETDPVWNAEKGNYALKSEIPTDYVDKETYSAYTASTESKFANIPTISDFKTINGEDIIGSGDIKIKGDEIKAGKGIYISEESTGAKVISTKSYIYYKTTDNVKIELGSVDYFDAKVISNNYINGGGVIEFDGIVTSIGYQAFFNQSRLENIVLPDSVTGIGGMAFTECSKLKNIVLPKSLKIIADLAFSGCKSLTSIEIPDSVDGIRSSVFNGCIKLTDAVVGSGIKSILVSTFYNCSILKNVTLKNGLPEISEGMFRATSIESLIIPESVTKIGKNAFHECVSLKEIVIPNTVNTIENVGIYIPEDGTLYCDEDWFNNLTDEQIRNLGNIAKWTRKRDKLSIEKRVNNLEDNVSKIPTHFKTINGESVIGDGNIVIQGGGGTTYQAGANISIQNNVISVTGLTNYDDTSIKSRLSTVEETIGYIDQILESL